MPKKSTPKLDETRPTITTQTEKLYDECREIIINPKRVERVKDWKKENGLYFNAQWTGDESRDLEATGQTDIPLNTVRRALRTLISQTIAGQPTAKFLPRDMLPTDELLMQSLESLQGLWNHCWYISGGKIILRRAVQNQLVMGLSYIACVKNPSADYYRGEIMFEDRLPWEMVVPLTSNKMDFSDSKRIYYRTLMTLSQALERLNVNRDVADKMRNEAYVKDDNLDYDVDIYADEQRQVYTGKLSETIDDDNRVCEWLESEEIIKQPAYLFKIEMPNNVLDTIIYEPPDGDNSDPQKIVEAELQKAGLQYANITGQEIKIDRVKNVIQVGRSVKVSEEILHQTSFSTIPVIDEDTYNPLSIGEMFFIGPIQKLLNKVFSLAVLHLQTSGSGDRLVGLNGAFGDTPQQVEAFEKNYTNPVSATELAAELEPNINIQNVIMRMQATPLQPAAVQTIQLITGWIDRIMGLSSMNWGDSSGAPRTLGATLSIKEWGDENARIPLIHLDYALQRLGNLWLDKAVNHYTFNKVVSSQDHTGLIQQYAYNVPSEDGLIINKIEGLRANIFVTSGTSMMLNRMSMLMMYKELMPLNPVFIKMFLLYSDIPEKFDILKEIDHTAQLEQQFQQLIPQVEELQKLTENQDSQITDLKKKIDLQKLHGTLKIIETKARERSKFMLDTADLVRKSSSAGKEK